MLTIPLLHLPLFEEKTMILGDLKNYDGCVDALTLLGDLSVQFKRDPSLPGILIVSQYGGFLGMISRDHYFEALGRPFGVELYSKHTAVQFYRQIGSTPLILDAYTRIEDAVKTALARQVTEIYEPIVVRFSDHTFKLVNMHTLLSAQCDLMEKLYLEVQQLSIKDPLTNLRNRRGFFEDANPQVQSAFDKQENLSALMVDIDNFKIVNDIYGHFVGDHVLKSAAEEIQKALRQTDLLGRFGGEEFIAILPDTTLEMALVVAERVRSRVENHQVFIDGYQISITVSVGVSHMQKASGSLDALLTQADQAMYAAKRAGRNQVATYQSIHVHQLRKGIGFEGELSPNTESRQKSTDAARIYDETIEGWARALELRDKETKGHAQRVTNMAIELAKRFGILDKELVNIRRGALLHDIGKIAIPDHILFKPGALSPEEWEIMRKHPVYAFELLSPITFLQDVIDIPYCHHEHWDGSGYPRGLKGEEIPLPARIFTIIDIWDALSTDRPYRQAWEPQRVCDYLRDESGKLLDPAVVEPFCEMLVDFEYISHTTPISTPCDICPADSAG
jgi:diguanylate cyclase (GGDEF)-like protein/putative nucleotidyltransferase with HDIG domain